ncbi:MULTISPECIES: cell division protein FtsZ [Haloarcula]|uniref:cell division protein FtsZ n=1 Tax=Haloarcula TaxID=2237 RepID=UPI000F8D5189|nr:MULTISPECIES: cell division protein FtsZ [Haloarcula]NHX40276.1 cell division protein FtsZ [Haloarcula sp. R1-2]
MSNKCKICLRDTEEPTIEEHIAANHAETPQSVSEVYPDRYDDIFDEHGEVKPQFQPDDPEPSDSDESGPDSPAGDPDPDGGISPGTALRTDTGSDGVDESPDSGLGSGADTGVSGPLSGSTGNKWMMVGVGGAGNHIIDAVLMRRDTLRDNNSSLADVWEGGLANYGSINTNLTELGETYYAKEDRGFSREALVTNGMIGYRQHNYSGAGRDWKYGRQLMKQDFDGEKNAIRDRLDLNVNDIEASQAVMLINSVTKGTGCGATPVLADNIRSIITEGTGSVDSMAFSKPLISSVVLPSNTEFGDSEMIRGVVGMAYLSKAVDGIIPFDNSMLDQPPADLAVDIDEGMLERYNPPMYTDINRLLVTFLEAFTMSSTPQSADTAGTARINGEVFDVPDSFRPVQRKYSYDEDRAYKPAVIMAPVIGKTSASTFDRSRLDTLARSTLLQGQLVEFDPKTAWGGTFMIYGPEEKMAELAPLLGNNELTDILSGEDFLERDSFEGPGSIDVYVNQLVVPHVDDVYLWGLLWNPHLPTLERMYDHARELVEHGESQEAAELREIWDVIEPLFDSLGRENMG